MPAGSRVLTELFRWDIYLHLLKLTFEDGVQSEESYSRSGQLCSLFVSTPGKLLSQQMDKKESPLICPNGGSMSR